MRKVYVLFQILFCGIVLAAVDPLVFAQAPENIYQTGKKAFDDGDYLQAVKYLFAYQRLVEGNIDQGLAKALAAAIEFCDTQILLALRTKQNLDKYGHITEVVIESSGKADGIARKSTRKYNSIPNVSMQKPILPSKAQTIPPSIKAKKAIGAYGK